MTALTHEPRLAAQAARRFEYRVLDTGKNVEEDLNRLGAQGWEVVGVTTKRQLFIAPPQAIILMKYRSEWPQVTQADTAPSLVMKGSSMSRGWRIGATVLRNARLRITAARYKWARVEPDSTRRRPSASSGPGSGPGRRRACRSR